MAKSKNRVNSADSPKGLSRRHLLGTLAGLGSAAAVGAPLQRSIAGTAPKSPKKRDVIVIGGGFAGCVAARELAHRGHNVTLLEAQSRLGGRSFTTDFAGKRCELGALMLSWKQPFLWAEVTRYGLEIEPIVGALTPERCYWVTGGKTYSAAASDFFEKFVPPVQKFYADINEAFPYPYAPLTNRAKVEELDKLSVLDRLKTFANQEERDFADNWASTPLGRDGSKVGLAATMALVSAFGGVQASLEGASFRLKDGTNALVKKIAEDGGFEICLGSPVASVVQTKSGVKVITENGESLTAAKVVLAAPVNTYENIEFNPPLSAAKSAVSKGKMAGGRGVHVNARIKGKMPPILAVGPSDLPLHLLMTTDILEDSFIVDAYGPDASILDGSDPAAVQKAIRNWLPDAEVLETVSYRWDLDPYSQGTWCGYGPGVLTKYFDALRSAEGNVHFASADSASAFRGFMEGAVESGVRVARDVHHSLVASRKT